MVKKFDESMLDEFVQNVTAYSMEISEYLRDSYVSTNHDGWQMSQDVETCSDKYVAQRWLVFIRNTYKGINIIAEESIGRLDTNGLFTVRIDSIDGSKHFRAGIPVFCSNFSLHKGEEALFAACMNPLSHELHTAIRGGGAYLGDKQIHVSPVTTISQSFIACEGPTSQLAQSNPFRFNRYLDHLCDLFRKSFRVRSFGLGAFGICLVASGACSAYIDLSGTTKVYDISAALMIANEAGATITDMSGHADIETLSRLTDGLVVSNGYVHQEILSLLSCSP